MIARSRRVLPVGEFFEALVQGLLLDLPARARGFEAARGRGPLLKLHYGHPETHFEAWHHAGAGRLEVGLHFEGDPGLNSAAHGFFRARIVEIKSALPRAELEPWDHGWARLYETAPAPDLSESALGLGVERLAAYITVLHPMLTEFWESR
jgi:hypothetical protein